MDEQKRLILAVVLSVIVLVGYQAFFVKPPQPAVHTRQAQPGQSTDAAEKQKPARKITSEPMVSDYSAQSSDKASTAGKENFRNISVTTPLYHIIISEKGGVVKSFELEKYKETNDKNSPLKQLIPEELKQGNLFLDLAAHSVPGLKNAPYTAKTDSDNASVMAGEKRIEFVYNSPEGIVVKKIFTFKADSYLIGCDIVFQNGSARTLDDSLVISTLGLFNDRVKKKSRFAFVGPIAFINNKYKGIKPKKIKDQNNYIGKIGWAGFTEQYFFTAVMPEPQKGLETPDAQIRLSFANGIVTNSYIRKMQPLDPGKQESFSFEYYLGPKSHKILSSYHTSLTNAVNFGFFNVIAKPLLVIMNLIYSVVPNYGVAIILLTIFIKLIFWPLGTKSYKSMNQMKKVQPLMTELRKKYKDDKQKMNQEIMALYKTYKVNPASGCLPMLVQMPIFFALYRMLYQAIELRHAPFFGWITDLSAPDRLFHFGFSIPFMQPPYGIPMLTLLMGASFLIQQKMTPTTGDPTQAKMMLLMPVFMTVLFINFPAGLVLYMFVNNIISMGQQYYIQKKFM